MKERVHALGSQRGATNATLPAPVTHISQPNFHSSEHFPLIRDPLIEMESSESMFVEPKTEVIQDASEGMVSVMKDTNEMKKDIAPAPYKDNRYSGTCIEMDQNEAVLLEPKSEHIHDASLENISVANEVAEDKSHASHAEKQYPGKELCGYVPRQWRQWRYVKQYPGKKRIPEPCEKVELSSLRNTVMDSSRITECTKTPNASDTSEDLLPATRRRREDDDAVSDSSPGLDDSDIAEENATRSCPRQQHRRAQNKTATLGCANDTYSFRGPEENSHVCRECRQAFRSSRALCKHVRLQHCANRPYHCDLCSAAYRIPSELKIHMRKHTGEKPFLCEVCSAAFCTRSRLTTHMRRHTGERPYRCAVCSALFFTRSELTNHVHMHTGERPYRCEVCSATFIQNSSLITHMRRHTGERPHRCIVCSATFIQNSTLITHMRRHTGERPHRCEVCSATFIQSGDLTRHMRKHTGERPYRCEVCSASFGFRGALTKHMLTHTGDV